MPRVENQKPFTAEIQRRRLSGSPEKATVDNAQLLAEIRALTVEVKALESRMDGLPVAVAEAAPVAVPFITATERAEAEELRVKKERDFGEIRLLKIELNALAHSIETTKKEISLLMAQSDEGDRLTTVTNELDAVVSATERATDSILDQVEVIGNLTSQIQAQEKDSFIRQLADEIQESTMGIFEACNFQDLTGQRITKVVNTMKYVEQRVDRMMEIWGRDTFNDLPIEPEAVAKRGGVDRGEENRLLNGPQDTEKGISQDEIDRLFD
ncbi:MAG: protein phosphatase CheZ [Rhodospirillum sp.]|nr:protein phosphatase CheZ [Rhodospirillum sp.]MCF8488900.1 protein phosphatase CheZ [Rhodospirillum sp.]MCF8500038.1 protein phosphatase CheZ [Rhodospirillum sp.]